MKTVLETKGSIGGRAILFLLVMLSACAVRAAGTNEIQLPTLAAGGVVYTNVTIIRANPAYAVVLYQEGITRVAMSNMPAVYQSQFGYTPDKAAQFLVEENQIQKQRRDAVNARQAAYQRSLAALVGKNQPLQITAVTYENVYNRMPLCVVDGFNGGILVEGLPDYLGRFLAEYQQIPLDIAATAQRLKDFDGRVIAAQNLTNWAIRRGTDQDFINADAAQKQVFADRRVVEDRLMQLEDRWARLRADYNSLTTIMAYPTGQAYAGKPLWVYAGVP